MISVHKGKVLAIVIFCIHFRFCKPLDATSVSVLTLPSNNSLQNVGDTLISSKMYNNVIPSYTTQLQYLNNVDRHKTFAYVMNMNDANSVTLVRSKRETELIEKIAQMKHIEVKGTNHELNKTNNLSVKANEVTSERSPETLNSITVANNSVAGTSENVLNSTSVEELCDEQEDEHCVIDHTLICVGDSQYCNLSRIEYMELLYEYITPTPSEWILIVSHGFVFIMGLVSINASNQFGEIEQ